jgi:hypothetical protein
MTTPPDPLQTLVTDLGTLATVAGGTATATGALTGARQVLALLATDSIVGQQIGPAVSAFYTAIAAAINDPVVSSIQEISTTLSTLTLPPSTSISDVAAALNVLQNALQAAQSLAPGGSSALTSAFAATSQFATLFQDLLSAPDTTTLADVAKNLNDIALQLGAIATAFTTASQGNT